MKKGFTLIEILITTTIIGVIVLGIAQFSKDFYEGYNFSFQEARIISQAEFAAETMEREIKEMQNGVDGSYPLVTADDQEVVFYADIDNDGASERVRYYLVGSDLIRQVFEFTPGFGNYACVGGCDICHLPGSGENTLTIPEPAWPAHAAHGDYLGVCTGGGGNGDDSSSSYEKIVASYITNGTSPLFTYYNGNWPGDEINNPIPLNDRLLDSRLIRVDLSVDTNEDYGPTDFQLSTMVHLRNLKDNI